jgi:hypothetical protein
VKNEGSQEVARQEGRRPESGCRQEACGQGCAGPEGCAGPKAAPAAKKPVLSPEQRYQMIQDAAYFIAERHGFNGDSAYFWSLAEAEINAKLN